MLGFSNRERFEGEELDLLTKNLADALQFMKYPPISGSKLIIEIYSLYENRFGCLSDYSTNFFKELQIICDYKMSTGDIHKLA